MVNKHKKGSNQTSSSSQSVNNNNNNNSGLNPNEVQSSQSNINSNLVDNKVADEVLDEENVSGIDDIQSISDNENEDAEEIEMREFYLFYKKMKAKLDHQSKPIKTNTLKVKRGLEFGSKIQQPEVTEIKLNNDNSKHGIITMKIPEFNGDPNRYKEFLLKFKTYCMNYNVTSDKYSVVLGMALVDNAASWFLTLQQNHPNIMLDGDEVLKHMNDYYDNEYLQQQHFLDYMAKSFTPKQTVNEAALELDKLVLKSGRQPDDDERKIKLYSVLPHYIQEELTKQLGSINNYKDLLSAARNIETANNLKLSRRGGRGGLITRTGNISAIPNAFPARGGYRGRGGGIGPGRGGRRGIEFIQCYKCKQLGHLQYHCPISSSNGTSQNNPEPPSGITQNNSSTAAINVSKESSATSSSNTREGSVGHIQNQLKKLDTVQGDVGGVHVPQMLIDNGATHSVIDSRLFQEINHRYNSKFSKHLITNPLYLPKLGQASDNSELLNVQGVIKLHLKIADNYIGYVTFVVVEGLNQEKPVYIGNDILTAYGISIVKSTDSSSVTKLVISRDGNSPIQINSNAVEINCNSVNHISNQSNNPQRDDDDKSTITSNVDGPSKPIEVLFVNELNLPEHLKGIEIGEHLSNEQQNKLKELLLKYKDCFAKGNTVEAIRIDIKHKIDTNNNAPIRSRPYRQPYALEEVINKQINDWLEKGVIIPCDGEWSSPVTVVTKKDGTYRVCGDFRELNKITKKDVFPTPNIEDQKFHFQGSTIFSGIDLKDAYLGVLINEEDQEKVAIITSTGFYKFIRMPFGLCNAPATYIRIINKIFRDYNYKFMVNYFDDLNIYSKSFDDHLTHLEKVFIKMMEYNLKAKASKCKFGVTELKWMSFVVSREGIKPDKRLIEKIVKMKAPENISEVRQFMGLCNYYHRFIKDFAKLSAPLYKLTRKNAEFKWNIATEAAFNSLKNCLTTYPILRMPNPELEYILYTDASDYAIGVILGQIDPLTNQEYVIGYYSRTLRDNEVKYSVTDKECKALVDGIKHFYYYLYGKPFTVIVDHISLTYLNNLKTMHGNLGRMAIYLQEYNFMLKYKPGSKHTNADALSRLNIVESSNSHTITTNGSISVVTQTQLDSIKDIQTAQTKDRILAVVIKNILDPGTDTNISIDLQNDIKVLLELVDLNGQELILKDGILYNRIGIDEAGSYRDRIVIPDDELLKIELLKKVHNESGHGGELSTIRLLRDRVWWKDMIYDTKTWIQSCTICARTKPGNPIPERKNTIISQGVSLDTDTINDPEVSLQKQLEEFPIPFSQLIVDHTEMTTDDSTTSPQYKYALVITDRATRWVEVYPSKTLGTEEYLNHLMSDWIPRYGVPKSILSDNGSAFNSDKVMETYRLYHIKPVFSTSYSPQSHGLVERFNRTVKQILRGLLLEAEVDSDGKIIPWFKLLGPALLHYRSRINSVTKYSPFMLTFGREANLPIDNILTNEDLYVSATDYIAKQIERLSIAHKIVCQQLKDKQIRNINYNLMHKLSDIPYNIGDHVYVKEALTKNKLSATWNGPYIIKEQLNEFTYIVKALNGKHNKPITINYRRMKKVSNTGNINQERIKIAKLNAELLANWH